MEKRKKIGLLLLAVIGITVALIWGVRIQEMKNENTENLADEEKNDDLKGTTIASVILLEDQTEKVMQTAMRVTAEKYGATVIEGQSGGELERETRLLSDYMEQEVDAICIYPVSPTGSLAGLENAAKQGIDIYSVADRILRSEPVQYRTDGWKRMCRVYPGKFSGQEAKNCNHPVQCTASGYQ